MPCLDLRLPVLSQWPDQIDLIVSATRDQVPPTDRAGIDQLLGWPEVHPGQVRLDGREVSDIDRQRDR